MGSSASQPFSAITGAFSVLVSPGALFQQYASWHALLNHDHGNYGWSVMNFIQNGLGLRWRTGTIQVAAIAIQAIPIVAGVRFGTVHVWRKTLMCSLLCFSVLFNHRAEYTTFAISSAAIGIWYTNLKAPSGLHRLLVLLAIVATILRFSMGMWRRRFDARPARC